MVHVYIDKVIKSSQLSGEKGFAKQKSL